MAEAVCKGKRGVDIHTVSKRILTSHPDHDVERSEQTLLSEWQAKADTVPESR